MLRKESIFTASCLTVLGLLLASCAPASQPPAAPTAAAATKEAPAAKPASGAPTFTPKPAAEQPRYGGILTISHVIDPPSLDMSQEIGFVANVLQCAYSSVTQLNPESPEEVIGDLAKSWEISKDGLTYTFHLHENVKFHDGADFTAEDARYSFDRMVNPPRGILSPRRAELTPIEKIEAPDKATLKFILKNPSAALLSVVSQGYVVVYSKAFVEKKGHMKNDVMGTGPYKLKSYSSNVALDFVKNPDYFIKGRPYVDGITFYIIRDTGTRLAAFRAGRVKLTGPGESGPTPSGAETVKRTLPDAIIVRYPANSFGNFILNTTEKPWNDIRARQAVHLAIDRQKAVEILGESYGEIGSNMPGEWGISKQELEKMPGWRQPKDADIAEAKRLLAAVGVPDGLTLKTLVRAERTYEQLSVYMSDQLAKIGIKLELDVKDLALRQKLVNEGAFNSHATMNSLTYPDPESLVRLWAPPAGSDWGMNWARLEDAKIFELLNKQSRAVDPAERKKAVRELDLRMIELATRPIVWWKQYLVGMWPEVKGYGKRNSNYSFEKYQDIWLAK